MLRLAVFGLMLSTAAHAGDRVSKISAARSADLRAMADAAHVAWPPGEVYLRVFKQERQVELWAGPKKKPLTLVKTYPICAASGELGPKRKEGDLQVPEGFYEISEFNPGSNFHLSMKVNYPNASDRVRSDKQTPGGLIYLHGNCASIGCIAIEDAPIEEVYLFAQAASVKQIPIHIFPMRLTAEALAAQKDNPNFELWTELAPGFQSFETTKRPPSSRVDKKTGAYTVTR